MITAASGLGETSRGFGATLGFCPTPFELPYGFSLLFSTARASLTPPRGAEGGAELGGWGGAELGWPGLKLGVAVVPEPVLAALPVLGAGEFSLLKNISLLCCNLCCSAELLWLSIPSSVLRVHHNL